MIIGKWRFQVLCEGILRIEWAEDGQFNDKPTAISEKRPLPTTGLNIGKKGDKIIIFGGVFTIRLKMDAMPCGEHKGLIVEWERGGMAGVWHIGARSSNLGGWNRGLDCSGMGGRHPRLKDGLLSRAGWHLYDDSRTPLLDDGGNLRARPEGRRSDWYLFVYGNDFKAGLKDLGILMGQPPLPLSKMFGLWWSRWHPYSDAELRALVERFEAEGMPLSALVIDMDWHKPNAWCHWDWNTDLFPKPEKFIKWCHNRGILVTLNVHPQELLRSDSHFEPFCQQGGVKIKPSQAQISVNMADPRQKKAAVDLLIKPIHDMGVDFLWIDGDAAHTGPELFHQYWTNRVFFEAAAKARGGKRPVIFSRCGGWGSQRYPIGFSGDTLSDWGVLRHQIAFTASGGNIGFHYWSNDTGGFVGEHIPEDLYIRWFQFSAFSPILRMHCSHGEREPWAYGGQALLIARKFFKLRQRLFPYIYDAARECSEKNLPLCRPLYIEEANNPNSYHYPDEYYFGRDILCAPITEAQALCGGVRTVYFPQGIWHDIFTGEIFKGDAARRVAAPLSQMPIYARGGALIPMYSEIKPDTLEIHAYTGANGASEIYSDDGESAEYLSGNYAKLACSIKTGAKKISFKATPWSGQHAEKISKMGHVLQIHTPAKKQSFDLNIIQEGKEAIVHIPNKVNLSKQLLLDDLIRRARVCRVLEEMLGSPEHLLLSYQVMYCLPQSNPNSIKSFFKDRLEYFFEYNLIPANPSLEMLLQELIGVCIETRIGDAAAPDVLSLCTNIWASPSMDKGWEANIRWRVPPEWGSKNIAPLEGIILKAGEVAKSEIIIHSPKEINWLGKLEVGAEVALRKGKSEMTFYPQADMDLSGIREAWIIGPFDADKDCSAEPLIPSGGFDSSVEYKGKYGAVRWRHARIPIDGRDVWCNIPLFDMHKLLETRGGSESAYLYFRVEAARINRFNLVTRNDEPCRILINGKSGLVIESFWRTQQINLDKGTNEILIRTQRKWGDWDFGAAITSFANNGPAEGLCAPRLKVS